MLKQRNATINGRPVIVRSGYERGSEGYVVKINLPGDSANELGEEIGFAYSETDREEKVMKRAKERAKKVL